MKGSIKVQVSNSHISFTLELERNITIICGDSATGKTTLIGMLRDYEENGRSSGVSVHCTKPCQVMTNADWEYRLGGIHDSIVFLDEGNAFVKSEAFARAVQNSSNYCHHHKRNPLPAALQRYIHSEAEDHRPAQQNLCPCLSPI